MESVMHLSTNYKKQAPKVTGGFEYIDIFSLSEFKALVINDHAPANFANGIRNNGNVITCDCVVMDVDNTEPNCIMTISQFMSDFKEANFYLATSRNHQKEKHSGERLCPAEDRYHVYFPLKRPMFAHEYKYIATQLVEQFPFFDPACKDASRFFFGNPDTEVFYNVGKILDIEPPKPQIELAPPDDPRASVPVESPDLRAKLFSGLQVAANSGAFDSRDKWVTLGMGLRRDGFTVEDWLSLSWPNIDRRYVQSCWDSFGDHGSVSGKSLTYIAKEYAPDTFRGVSTTITSPRTIDSTVPSVNVYQYPKPSHIEDHLPLPVIEQRKLELQYTDDKGETKIIPDWYYKIVELDPDIANCIHYDYTMGTKMMSYHNTEILKNAIIQRLRKYLSVSYITDKSVERIINFVMSMNMNRNQVAERIDYLKDRHPVDESKCHGWELDEFLKLMEFTNPADCLYSNDELRAIYKEVWHLFFMRMHMHIDGTRLHNGGFKGLIENDIIPVLQGPQGVGKTTLVNYIAMNDPELYIDLGSGSKGQFGDAATQKACRGKLIAELGEMKIMRKSDDIETVKSFVSKKQYEVDVKYVEFTKPLPVTISFIGTANMGEYLSDSTGNRRWWPIWVRDIDLDGIKRQPILIEKLHAFYAREAEKIPVQERFSQLKPSPMLTKYLEASRSRAMIRYSDYEAVIDTVGNEYQRVMMQNEKYHKIQNFEIEKLLAIKGYNFKVTQHSIINAMQELGYNRERFMHNGRQIYGWRKHIQPANEY